MKKRILSLTLALTMVLALVPTAVAYNTGKVGEYTVVSCGSNHTAAIDENGTLWMWGDNGTGQLGNGGLGYLENSLKYGEGRIVPTQIFPVKVLDNVAAVSCGANHTAAIKTDNTLWMWGNNGTGQLGNGNTDESNLPVKVLDNVAAVSCGADHTAAIKTDNTLWMWGDNFHGELGNGSEESSATPVKVLDNVAAVSSGGTHTAALKTDGTLWIWGWDLMGQLGIGTYDRAVTTPVKVLDNVAAVSCGFSHTAAIKTDGTLWIWGMDQQGLLSSGNGGIAIVTPVKVLDNVAAVSCGADHTAAIKADGTLWTWGNNSAGQLGDSSMKNSSTPVKVLDNAAAVSCGADHTAVIKSNGTLWTFGGNNRGKLGNGGSGNEKKDYFSIQTVPVQITLGDGAKVKAASLPTAFSPAADVSTSNIPEAPSSSTARAYTASPTNDALAVDGGAAAPTAYKINGANYFKLRDMAALLTGSAKQFDVGYDNATKSVTITTGKGYTKLAGDLQPTPAGTKDATVSNNAVYIDGVKVELTVYKINGANYFKLRDLGQELDFYVGWEAGRGMFIETDKFYDPAS